MPYRASVMEHCLASVCRFIVHRDCVIFMFDECYRIALKNEIF